MLFKSYTMKRKVLVVEDERLIASCCTFFLSQKFPEFECFEAHDGIEALRMAKELKPDLVLMDYKMPRMNGLVSIELIRKYLPETKFIMVSGMLTREVVLRALSLGVSGFLDKIYFEDDMILAINQVLEGKEYITGDFLKIAKWRSEQMVWEKNTTSSLFSPRQQEVLSLIVSGLTSREIAQRLNISKRTVDRHRTNLLARSGAKNFAELIDLTRIVRN
jgi:DNA-binding NarL/FixJ family response regulator